MERRIRSPNYPALGLPEAIEKAAGIYRTLHNHTAPREVIAKAMGYTGLNGASATAISALHKYGLLERSGEENKISDRALRILHPHSPAERAEAIREAAQEPALFAEIGERFPGKHPNDDLLRNYLVRNKFAPAALTAVISAYRETSDMVLREGVAHDAGVGQHPEDPPDVTSLHPATSTPTPAPPTIQASASERPIGRYDFEGGAYVRIAASIDLDTEEALDMVETLIQLKRKEIERANKRANATPSQPIASGENDQGEDK